MAAPSNQAQNGPATPVYILRGHGAPIHALDIFSQNLRLVSGDANGWVVIWDLSTKRPVTVWKAHEGAVLEVKGFNHANGITEVYTHGRDHKLCVWKIRAEDEDFLNTTLPVDLGAESGSTERKTQPWLLHSLPVNALNFCAFSMTSIQTHVSSQDVQNQPDSISRSILFAVPNAIDSGGIDIFHLPSERRLTTISSDPAVKTGMVMAVNIFVATFGDLYVASAYEDGHVMTFVHKGPITEADFELSNIASNPWKWEKLYASRPHTQPVLSIDVSRAKEYFLSSSADALIIKHRIPGTETLEGVPIINYKDEAPLKTFNTKHSGQQGLKLRDDGKIFATAGWDSRVRVYSCKTMKELAVLKWHKDGCYSVAFGNVATSSQPPRPGKTEVEVQEQSIQGSDYSHAAVQDQRNQKIQQTHWLAAGSKDGKISLWDIY